MPLISCVDFEWVLSSRGHKVVVNKELSGQLVLPNAGPLRVTRPLQQHPGLFKQFAKLEQTALGVVSFANRFGLLESDPHQNDLSLWFTSANDFAAIADATISSSSELRMSSLIRINEIVKRGVITEITKAGLVLKPRSLLAAMAVQLGFWLQNTDDDRIGQCVECGNTWLIGPSTGHRVSRKYCSSNCSDAARNRRKRSKWHGDPNSNQCAC